jgi:adenine-specific DNA-methyltransferase
MFYGIKAYQVGKGKPPQTKKILEEKPFTSNEKKDGSFLPLFDGKHVGRYELLWRQNNWIKYGAWLAEPRISQKYEGEKILIRKIVGRTLIGTYVSETSYCNTLVFVLKKKDDASVHYKYLLGILNSQFIGWYFRKKFQISSEDTFPQIMIRDILQLPIRAIDFTKPGEKKMHDDLVALVDKMLDLHKQLGKASFDSEKEPIQRQIEATDQQIDRLVCELYDLKVEEINVVEGMNG